MGENRLFWILERQLAWIASADSKVAVLGTVQLAMIAVSLSDALVHLPRLDWASLPLLVSTALLSISLFFVKATLSPRLSGPDGSLIFFGGIAKLDIEAFKAALEDATEDQWTNDLVHQIHRNAQIAAQKHRNTQSSIFWLTLATPAWFATILL